MEQYQVKITAKVYEDMRDIYNYIADSLHTPDTALKQYDRIASAIESLDVSPKRIKLMDTEPECSQGLRQLLIDNYSVFFVVNDNVVTVLRVIYSASNIRRKLRM